MEKGEFNLKGFTIIEVSLVLAIAGLIFLMIFIALPALQRQQRDTARKEDITAFISAVKKYQTNNRGALPNGNGKDIKKATGTGNSTEWSGFLRDYLGSNFEDPSTGEGYSLVVASCNSSRDSVCADNNGWKKVLNDSFDRNIGTMYVITQAKCAGDEDKGVVSTSNIRKIAVLYKLENGGVYCENS